jgi:hypothetical protein
VTPPERFPYTLLVPGIGEAGYVPFLPCVLTREGNSIAATGLLDTGASVNVLPYSIGLQLGLVWERQNIPLRLFGNLAGVETRVALVQATIGSFAPVELAFGWAKTDTVPLLLGQVNFFAEFDVCFYRSQLAFEIAPKSSAP